MRRAKDLIKDYFKISDDNLGKFGKGRVPWNKGMGRMNTNDRVGRLVLIQSFRKPIKNYPRQSREFWHCQCDCGNRKEVWTQHLRKGAIQSCGCLVTELLVARNTRHGGAVRGKREKLWDVWAQMHYRCNNPKSRDYKNYGGRQIRISRKWDSYADFREWSFATGYREGLTIERKNNDGNYCPKNCTWIEKGEQSRNQRSNIRITAFGETKLVADWERDPRCRVSRSTIMKYFRAGVPAEQAIAGL
jgi:hypothetical protein